MSRFVSALLIVLIWASSCTTNNASQPTQQALDTVQTEVPDEVAVPKEAKTAVVRHFFDTTSVPLFAYYEIPRMDTVRELHDFIPIPIGYENGEFPVIDTVRLGMRDPKGDEFHALTGKYRARALQRAGLSEKDKVWIYSVEMDTLVKKNVQELKLVAFINPYGAQGKVRMSDYMCGFVFPHGMLGNPSYTGQFAYFGLHNPFIQSELKPIAWEVADSIVFPSVSLSSLDSARKSRYIPGAIYTFDEMGYTGYIQNYETSWGLAARMLVVIDAEQRIVYSKFYAESEGSGLRPLNGVEGLDWGGPPQKHQWIGRLIKGKPPVIFGFQYFSFGCPPIDFLDTSSSAIWIFCDNRH